ncbi:MAG: hypothetical protein V4515_08190 [Chloroflexota bacterium]
MATTEPGRYAVVVAYTAAAAETLPDTYAAIVRGTKAEVDAVLAQIRENNPLGDAKSIPLVEVDAADAFEKIMMPF